VQSSTPPAEKTAEVPSAEQIGALLKVDPTTPPTGPSVHELFTVDDAKKIVGREDIVFAEAT